jgi:hypothetical protein
VTDTERLLRRLRAMGADLPPCTELRRTHRRTRTLFGTWSWFAYCPDPAHPQHTSLRYGSHWPVWVLLRAKGLAFTRQRWGDICIDPVPEQEALELWQAA